jgi:prepilin-type N-terminal cleavage/methylation domain-containing protein
MKIRRGFTLIEVMVVVGIIGVLASVLYINFNETRTINRDQERQGDLRLVQNAIELYKLRYGRYPEGCRGAGVWSGQVGTTYACPSGGQYIIGLAPEFIPTLPTDPRLNGNDSGYVYTTNAERSVYKFMARRTVEADATLADGIAHVDHPFKSCDVTFTNTGLCDNVHPSGNKPNHCFAANAIFQSTYAVWGGRATGINNTLIERLTEDIACEIP